MNHLSRFFLTVSIIGLSILCFSSKAKADQSVSILGGVGLTFNTNSSYGGNGQRPGFYQNGFIMGCEYSHSLGPTPFSFNATFITSDAALIGLGFDLFVIKFSAKVGYGLSNSTPAPDSPNSPVSTNYGVLAGVGVEVPVASNLGLTANYITNNSYLGGIVLHWEIK